MGSIIFVGQKSDSQNVAVPRDLAKAFAAFCVGTHRIQKGSLGKLIETFLKTDETVQKVMLGEVTVRMRAKYAAALRELADEIAADEPAPRKHDIAKKFNGESDEDADRRESQTGPPVEPPPHRPKGRGH